MILVASERGGAYNLARHLMRGAENEHVEMHDLRGFAADDLHGALQEAYAISRGTRCKNFLFSLSLNPPETETVPADTFEATIERIEEKLGLSGQPRAIVFHEKQGRRHAHCVWSRIDAASMTAINLPHFKNCLNTIAKELFLEHGWPMPEGLVDRRKSNPLNFSREEWQQAKRVKQDAKQLKALFQECWAASDDRRSFETALQERGYWLAKGRRGFLAVDWRGEVYALSRYTGVKAKALKERLGSPKDLQSDDAVKAFISERMTDKLRLWIKETEAKAEKRKLAAEFQREQMVQRHRKARAALKAQLEDRKQAEDSERAARTPRGLRGLWGWISGRNKKIRLRNALHLQRCEARDRAEKHDLIQAQLTERRALQAQIKHVRAQQHAAMQELTAEAAQYLQMAGKVAPAPSKDFDRDISRQEPDRTRRRDDGPEFDPN